MICDYCHMAVGDAYETDWGFAIACEAHVGLLQEELADEPCNWETMSVYRGEASNA